MLQPSIYLYAIYFFFLIYLIREKYFHGVVSQSVQMLRQNLALLGLFVALTLVLIFLVDSPVANLVKSGRLDWAIPLTGYITPLGKGDTFVYSFPITVFVAAMLLKHKFFQHIFATAAAAAFVAGVLVQIPKVVLSRARPLTGDSPFAFFNWDILFARKTFLESDYLSMASGDVITATALCVPLVYYLKSSVLRFIFVLLPLGVAFARVHVNAHWASDVFAGLVIGTFIGLIFCNKNPETAIHGNQEGKTI
jgi:membrane-associated phospholipid phosphatase